METKIALLMDLPEGKLPGFYAQIVKALAGKTQLFDRDKEMLIVSTIEEERSVLSVMEQYNVKTERMELLYLPDHAELTDQFEDYGFISRSEHPYLYKKLAQLVRIEAISPQSERKLALLQLDEHLLACYEEGQTEIFAFDRQLQELVAGIAKAYKCEAQFLL
ncbi:hypothetical protein [Paenibacillus hexagrammi]|uniref:Uncharacterized protein n=1 Tax=Paenibacillus hexagrammi TaxID=2908839 RepID=A0ABY3SM35_9BACL|nr:hypothetical protein [Paenibacillus sp. YPD9-1]UJF35114.1 hypothetical protein L0M14_08260 [Paenibacillus sp. YPD9-1]